VRALVATPEGFHYTGGAEGDDHIFTKKTEYATREAVDTVVAAELAEATDDASTVALGLEVVSTNPDDAIYEDFDLGDAAQAPDINRTLERYRTVSFLIRENRNGVVSTGMELNSRLEDESARQRTWLEKATPGTLSGRADAIGAADLGAGVSFGTLPTSEIGSYQQSGYLLAELDPDDPEDGGHSDDWPVDEPILIYRVRFSLFQAGDTDTIVHLRKNGGGPFSNGASNFFHEIVIPAGTTVPDDDSTEGAYVNQTAFKGDLIRCATFQAGDYARGLVVRVKTTSQT
jgi:hypothetical protein